MNELKKMSASKPQNVELQVLNMTGQYDLIMEIIKSKSKWEKSIYYLACLYNKLGICHEGTKDMVMD